MERNNLWKLYEKAQTPYKWHKSLFSYAKKLGSNVLVPFDETAVDFLIVRCPIYKMHPLKCKIFL